jgi:hypothetical protein
MVTNDNNTMTVKEIAANDTQYLTFAIHVATLAN